MKQNVDQSLRRAASLSARGSVSEAEGIYRQVLERFPTNKRALEGMRALSAPKDPKTYEKGVAAVLTLYDQGRLREALDHLRLLIDLHPTQPDLHNLAGAASAGTGQLEAAVESYDRAIALRPDYAEVWSNRASALIGLQRLDEALVSCEKAIELQPVNAGAHSNRGIILKQLGRPEEAIRSYDSSLRLHAGSADVHYNRGNALLDLKRPEEAVASYDKAVELRPTYVSALSNRGNALKGLGRLDEALDSYSRAIALQPNFAEAHSNLGIALLGLKRLDEAYASCRKAVDLQPELAVVHYNFAIILHELQRLDEALAAYDIAVARDPGHAEAHANRGHVLYELHRLGDAAEAYAQAVTLKPEDGAGFFSLANVLQELGRLDEAVECYARTIAIDPGHGEAAAQLAFQKARMCDWTVGEKPDLATLGIATRAIAPSMFLMLEDEPRLQLLRARKYASEKYGSVGVATPKAAVRSAPLRIGYFSADFHDHAVMFQLARMFELHDRARFSVQAYSFGPSQDSPMRTRLKQAFDSFHDVRALESRQIAELARHEGIDIAIDLMGYTAHARTDIFAMRPAPVQIAYMGYPGTLGAPFIDYLVADTLLIPDDQRENYAEKIIYLPETYQANDDCRRISDRAMTRAELGLPDAGFVFCCFNNSFKITPTEFDIWMRLLARVDGSVLWLFEANRWMEDNLRAEARKRGIDPARLIFAGRMPHAEHLARLKQADLFLDCFLCNAHATASDALWAGVPVLTMPGQGFAARVGASVLHGIGLPELVTRTPKAYEQLALDLALNPVLMTAMRTKLAANRSTSPLFDSERFTRHIETAFELAHQRQCNSLQPDHIIVPRRA